MTNMHDASPESFHHPHARASLSHDYNKLRSVALDFENVKASRIEQLREYEVFFNNNMITNSILTSNMNPFATPNAEQSNLHHLSKT